MKTSCAALLTFGSAAGGVLQMYALRLLAAAALLGLVSCSGEDAAPGDQPGVSPINPSGPVSNLETKYNVGDVEYAVKTVTVLADESRTGAIAYTESETRRHDLAMAEATVTQPYPTNLWLRSVVSTPLGFRDTDAVLLKQGVYIDGREEPIEEKSFVWSGEEGHTNPSELQFDLMPHLDGPSGSVLLYTRVDITWFPDRAPMTVSLDAPPNSPQDVVEKLSNTLRVTFE
jgi:hypothetical protein